MSDKPNLRTKVVEEPNCSDPLEDDGALTLFEYQFLKGNVGFYPSRKNTTLTKNSGAAATVVSEWCRRHGYGEFGVPTVRGKLAMEEYER